MRERPIPDKPPNRDHNHNHTHNHTHNHILTARSESSYYTARSNPEPTLDVSNALVLGLNDKQPMYHNHNPAADGGRGPGGASTGPIPV